MPASAATALPPCTSKCLLSSCIHRYDSKSPQAAATRAIYDSCSARFSFFRKAWLHSQYCSFQFSPLCYLFDFRTAQYSASQGYGRVSFSAIWLLMLVRHKPLSRLTGCGRLIRIIAPPVPLFSATRTVGSPLYSIRGREEVSLCPRRLIAPRLPHRDDEMRLPSHLL